MSKLARNRVRFAAPGGGERYEVSAEREKATQYWKQLAKAEELAEQGVRPPPTPQMVALHAFRAAANGAMRQAANKCQPRAGSPGGGLGPSGAGGDQGPPKKVVVPEPDAPVRLKSCLLSELMTAALRKPPPTVRGRHVGPLHFSKPAVSARTRVNPS